VTTSSVGKMCLYCSRPIAVEDRISMCDRCFAAHHEECWERNGRCSTFRCAGVPRTMLGADYGAVIRSAVERSNEEPQICPFCTNKTFAGFVQGRLNHAGQNNQPGLLFSSTQDPTAQKKSLGRKLKEKLGGTKSWFLPGAVIKGRSCGKCKRLYLWGLPVDEEFVRKFLAENDEHFCPHCASELWPGLIHVSRGAAGNARFECDEAPDLHKDWLGHNLLDRFILNKWHPTVNALPGQSCPDCLYTEVAGRPIYRFL
jgi:hypothetical protein